MKGFCSTVFVFLCFVSSGTHASDIDSSFSVKWHNGSWVPVLPDTVGELFPAGPPWNMVGPYDFDNDGYGDFVVASSYAGQYCNGVYHYEATDDNSIDVQWVYTFYDLSCAFDAYSSVAVGDIDGDNNPEILSLVDTSPGVSGQKGLQVFEWDPDSSSFLSSPTYTWDMGLDSVWEAAQILVAELDGDDKQEIIVSVMDGPWSEIADQGGSSRLMIFELENIIDDSAVFNIEYVDDVWTNWSGYNISMGDLDNDGLTEIYIIAYDYYHIIIYENTGEDTYQNQNDIYLSSDPYERGNQSIIITDIDNNGSNELFAVTSGTATSPGSFYVVQGTDDVSTLSLQNFNLFSSYSGGLRQINMGDADGDGKPNLYLAGHNNEAVYDWEFIGGDPHSLESYSERIIYLDGSADNSNYDDNGWIRVAKLFPGDIDNDGYGDIIFSSASFALYKPTIFMIEHDGTLKTDKSNYTTPDHITISQNYPNPFNPKTEFRYELNELGQISLKIYDIMGRQVYTLYDGFQQAGIHKVFWSGIDQNNRSVSSGIYFYQLQTKSLLKTRKMVLNR